MFFFELIIGIISGSLILLVILIGTITLLLKSRYKKCSDFVLLNSKAIKELSELNNITKFHDVVNVYSIQYDNEDYFDNVSTKDLLLYKLDEDQESILNQFNLIDFNKDKYSNYILKVNKISLGNFIEQNTKLNISKLQKVEKELFEKQILKPVIKPEIEVVIEFLDIDTKKETFDINEIYKFVDEVNDKIGTWFNNKDVFDAIARVERSLVSNELRDFIKERDGHKCKCCGSTSNLEIDHIKPISKGGKSTEDNLQTLCRRCNQEKGNKTIKY